MAHPVGPADQARCLMGNDYYLANEHMVPEEEDSPITASGETFGCYVITNQYFDRFHLPVTRRPTSPMPERAPGWLSKEWAKWSSCGVMG